MGLAEAIKLKCNAEKEKYLSVYDVIDIINSDDTELVIHIMDSFDLFSLTVYELNNLDPFNPLYKPICNSYELKQKIIDYRKARRQFIHEDNNFDEYITLQRCLKKNLWSRFDLLKIEKIVKNTSLIVWGDSNALYSMYSDMINRSDSEYYELPKISQQAIKDYINLGSYQRELINLVSYSPEQIIGLITNDDPAHINRDEKYRVYWDMVSAAINANELTPINEKEEIGAEQVKAWLAKRGFIYKSFNDDLIIERSVQNEEPQKHIAKPEQEAADAKATGNFLIKTPTLTQSDPKTSEPLESPNDDEPTHPKSVGSMQALVTTLIKMAEYDKADLADPYGELNKLIQAKAEVLGLSVKKDFIAKWLKKADDVL